jgi:hypothetical protein
MAAALPESSFERMTAEAREKERLERQKMLVSLPRSKVEQQYLASVAEKVVDLREAAEDLVLVAGEETVDALKVRLVQGSRAVLDMAAKLHRMSLVAAKDGPDCAQKIFNPAPTYGELNEEEAKQLEKYRKEREASKKKETADLNKSSWKGAKRAAPYSKTGYGGFSGGYGNWALQQMLIQQLASKQAGSGGQGNQSAAGLSGASGSGQQPAQDNGYAAKIALARIQYPCHGCGVMGHWKKDGMCKAADVAAHIKRRMAEQDRDDKEDEGDESSGMLHLIWNFEHYSGSVGQLFACKYISCIL